MAGRLFLILWLCLAVPVGAGAAEETRQRGIDPAVLTDGFLGAHPDLRWRNAGIQAYREKDYEMALVYFRRAARYADKPSQAMIAEMYWEGRGVPQDRPIAYAWMDIAAERLYPDLVAFRERYWDALSEAERAEALERGQEILAQYGDEVAKPRLEAVLRRARRQRRASGDHPLYRASGRYRDDLAWRGILCPEVLGTCRILADARRDLAGPAARDGGNRRSRKGGPGGAAA